MISIIIPTKSNLNILLKCLSSLKNFNNKDIYKLYIADTGSSDEELSELETFLKNEFTNYTLIKYNYYNYAKINNDVIQNYIANDDSIDLLLFCNNDIEFVSNIIDQLYLAYNSLIQRSINVGTIGCRLLYPNGKIQHDGQFIKNNINSLDISHNNLNKDPNIYVNNDFTKVTGNTFALTLIEKNTFISLGMLNETYKCCFEDVEFNLKCIKNNKNNYILPTKFYAIHHESYTRKNTSYHFDIEDYKLLYEYIRGDFVKC